MQYEQGMYTSDVDKLWTPKSAPLLLANKPVIAALSLVDNW